MEARHRYENNLRKMKDHKAFVDAGLAGAMMATVKDLQRREVAALKVANEAHLQSQRVNVRNSQFALEKKLAASEEARAAAEERVTAVEQAECTSTSRGNPASPALASAKMTMTLQQKKLQDLGKLLQATAKDTASGTRVEELNCAQDVMRQKVVELKEERDRAQAALEHLDREGQQLLAECEKLRASQCTPTNPLAEGSVVGCRSRGETPTRRAHRKGKICRTPGNCNEKVGSPN